MYNDRRRPSRTVYPDYLCTGISYSHKLNIALVVFSSLPHLSSTDHKHQPAADSHNTQNKSEIEIFNTKQKHNTNNSQNTIHNSKWETPTPLPAARDAAWPVVIPFLLRLPPKHPKSKRTMPLIFRSLP